VFFWPVTKKQIHMSDPRCVGIPYMGDPLYGGCPTWGIPYLGDHLCGGSPFGGILYMGDPLYIWGIPYMGIPHAMTGAMAYEQELWPTDSSYGLRTNWRQAICCVTPPGCAHLRANPKKSFHVSRSTMNMMEFHEVLDSVDLPCFPTTSWTGMKSGNSIWRYYINVSLTFHVARKPIK